MFQYTFCIVIEKDLQCASLLVRELEGWEFRDIKSCHSTSQAWRAIQMINVKSSIQIVFVRVESTRGLPNFLSRIMHDPDLSHIKVILVGEQIESTTLKSLFSLGAVGHMKNVTDKSALDNLRNRLLGIKQAI